MALLAGSTGLRRSEIIALTWSDLDVRTNGSECLELLCARPIREHEDRVLWPPVPINPIVLNALLDWRAESLYATEADFLFPGFG
jgi:hypothetical protein